MTGLRYAPLGHRAPLHVVGDDAQSFLQGLVSNDVTRVSPARAVHAALLTPQGKFLHDLFLVAAVEGGLVLDVEAGPRRADLKKRLSLYRLRARVTIAEMPDEIGVVGIWGEGSAEALGLPAEAGCARRLGDGIVFVDPRHAGLGLRAVGRVAALATDLAALGFAPGDLADWDRTRLALGVPDGSRDLELEKSILLESGFDELNGVDWKKGCYMGQELTARTKYRGLVKKRLVPVVFDGAPPAPGTKVLLEGAEVGELRSGTEGIALALLRLEAMAGPLEAAGRPVRAAKPDWVGF